MLEIGMAICYFDAPSVCIGHVTSIVHHPHEDSTVYYARLGSDSFEPRSAACVGFLQEYVPGNSNDGGS